LAVQDLYKRKIEEHLKDESRVKFVIADGTQFEHPLAHISKTLNDLPVCPLDDRTWLLQ
jgi:endoplasmic reticulum resident protein 44